MDVVDGGVCDVDGARIAKDGNDGGDDKGNVAEALLGRTRGAPGVTGLAGHTHLVLERVDVEAGILQAALLLVALQDAGPLGLV